MPRFQYAGLELISLFRLSKRLGPPPRAWEEYNLRSIKIIGTKSQDNIKEKQFVSLVHLVVKLKVSL